MLLVQIKHYRTLLQLVDGIVACFALMAAYYLRSFFTEYLHLFELADIGGIDLYLRFLPFLLVATPFILSRFHFYHLTLHYERGQIMNLAIQTALMLFLLMISIVFFLKTQAFSRLVFAFFVPICAFLLVARDMASRRFRLGFLNKEAKSLIVVTDRMGETSWQDYLEQHPQLGFRLARELDLTETDLDTFVRILHQEAANLVIFDLKKGRIEDLAEQIAACEEEGIEAWLVGDLFKLQIAQAKVDYFGQTPLLIFTSTPGDSWQLLLKTLFDRFGAAGLLIFFSPLLFLIALLIRLTSKGPALFTQQRSGLYGRPFTIYKFRSMVSDAEQRQIELEKLNEMSGPVFKVSNDPRITAIGRLLRKTSLDELPQLLNVLRGEMSLVGPRPLPIHETERIEKNDQRRRLSVKPGITCLWQVQGRNNVKRFEDWVRLDLQYIDNWSLGLDFKILFDTIPAVLFGRGAK